MAYSYKGAISFGLVYIPVTLTVSVKENEIGFKMLEKKTKSRVKYKKTCVDCGNREIKNEDIVKGYQYEKDKYVIFTDEDFEKLKTPKDKNITIERFVSLEEIDPIYFDRAYFVKPVGADKAYHVLLKAMESAKKAGIAKTVLGNKETLVLLRARKGKMLVNTLYFHDEIQEAPQISSVKIAKQELDLAKNLIEQMSGKFEPEKYKDDYAEKLQKAIKRKIAGNEIVEAKEEKEPVKIINLMDALKQSIATKKTSPQKSKMKKAE